VKERQLAAGVSSTTFLATHVQTFPVRAMLWRAKLPAILEEAEYLDGL
jgi:hypothetical protein